MKKNVLKGLVVATMALAGVATLSLTSVSAESVYQEYSLENSENVILAADVQYSLEEMLNYALQDEYMAQAEYQAIIQAYGEVKPFTNILQAEQTHIDLLLPLFEEYGFVVPANNASESVVIPESITSALATGVEAEQANIAMYQAFLAQDNLPDDVRSAFEYLVNASENHLQAFSQDRYAYLGNDMMNQIRNQWQKMFAGSNGGNGNGSGYQYQGENGQQAGTSSTKGTGSGTCQN